MPRTLILFALLAVTRAGAQDLYDRQVLLQPGQLVSNELVDFGGDDHPDLVSVLKFGDLTQPPVRLLAVSKGNGRGGFGTPVVSEVPTDPAGSPLAGFLVVLADLDEDGVPDAIASNDAPGGSIADVQTLLGDATGSFALHSTLPTPATFFGYPLDLETADFDGDGHADGLITSTPELLVFRGDGTGDLDAGVVSTDGSSFGRDVDVGDVDGDGRLDLVMTQENFATDLLWLRGDGLGGFAPGVAIPIGVFKMREIALADFDADGALDVAAAGVYPPPTADGDGPSLLRVVAGHGDGSFDPPVFFPHTAYAGEIRAADMDGDGLPDVVTTTGSEVRVSFDPLGAPGPADYAGPFDPPAMSGLANTLALGDLDSDGDTDAVCGDGGSDLRLFNIGDGSFAAPPAVELPDHGGFVRLEDMDGDGALDALVVPVSGNMLRLLGDGAGGFGAPQSLPAVLVSDLAVADLDGDGTRDIATANTATHDLSILLADGAGFVNSEAGGWPWFTWNQAPMRVRAADLDGDGHADLVVAKSLKASFSLIRSDGAGGHLAPENFGPVEQHQPDLELGDMNEDGALDLVAARVQLNDGDGHFTPGVPVAEPLVSFALVGGLELSDMDGDGHLDAVFEADVYSLSDPNLRGLITRPGDGHGELGPSKIYPEPAPVLATADLDGDGLRDVLTAGGDSGLLAAFGDGAGSFTHVRSWAPSAVPIGPAIGDIDGDARPDLVLADFVLPSLVTLLHAATPFAWSDLGGALAGAHGAPRLDGHGPLLAGTELGVQVDLLPHDALLTLVFGGSRLDSPFFGGVLVPSPDRIVAGLPTGPEGFLALHGTWPSGFPSGFEIFLQAWVPDATAPQGWAASNGLRLSPP